MKSKIICIAILFLVGCSKNSDGVIDAMKSAACKSDSKKFLSYIDKETTLKNLAANMSESGKVSDLMATGLVKMMGDNLWDKMATEVNEGTKSEYCTLSIRAAEKNENHAKYVVEYASHKLATWELHKNDAGFQIINIGSYNDYLNFNWGDDKETVKKKTKGYSGQNEIDFNNETKGLVELQFSNAQLSDTKCEQVAFILFENRLASIAYFCSFTSKEKMTSTENNLKNYMKDNYGQAIVSAEKKAALEWKYVNTNFKLSAHEEKGKYEMGFVVSDARINISDEIKKREVKK